MEKNWKILEPDARTVNEIRRSLKCSPIIATLLANRHIASGKEISAFFSNTFTTIQPPFCLKDMAAAIDRICRAIKAGEKILIFGDYDVDGITATVLLYQFLTDAGAAVTPYIPHRISEGYSLQSRHITEKMIPGDIDLIITVDCGSSGHDAIESAKAAGIDVIITDHHAISGDLPRAVAVINPKRPDCSSGLADLAGVGVAFYLVMALRKQLRDDHHWKNRPEPNLRQYCDLVALGTIADVVPLKDENRIFVTHGLDVMRAGNRVGINALVKASGLDRAFIDSEDIAFRLAPRLNAAGRLSHADMGVSLLTAGDEDAADQIAGDLCKKNFTRQLIEKEMLTDIDRYVNDHPEFLQKRSIVLAHPGWHIGLLGIIASRMTERYAKPVVLFSKQSGVSRGSARSIPGFDLYQGLERCSNTLEAFGGHPMAAGLSIKTGVIDQFQKIFEKTVRDFSSGDGLPQTLSIDFELDFHHITDRFIDDMTRLQPYGAGNREPLFLARDVKVFHSARIGKDKCHKRMRVGQLSEKAVNAIQFNVSPEHFEADAFDCMIFHLRWNHYKGRKTAQIIVKEVEIPAR